MSFIKQQHRPSLIRFLLLMLLFQMFSQHALATSLNLSDTGNHVDVSHHASPLAGQTGDEHHATNSGCDDGECLDMFCQTICHAGITVTLAGQLVPVSPLSGRDRLGQHQNSPLGIDLYPDTKPPQTSF